MKRVVSTVIAVLLPLLSVNAVFAMEESAPLEKISLSAHEGMKVSWTTKGESVDGYKVVWSLASQPTYPILDGMQVLYVGPGSAKIAYLKAFDGEGEYHVRVCEYLEERCGLYSNEVVLITDGTSTEKTEDEKESSDDDEKEEVSTEVLVDRISLRGSSEDGMVKWVVVGEASMGVKVLVSRETAPEYPARKGDQAHYVESTSTDSFHVKPHDGSGEYFVRVCAYNGEGCEVYSNEVTLSFASKALLEGFKDVEKSHENYEAIDYLREKAAVKGFDDESFRPEQPINRAEFLKIVMEASDYTPGGARCFSDVVDEWFAEYVCAANKEGFVNGFGDGTFRPTQPINFAEATKIIAKVLALQTDLSNDENWYQKYVVAMQFLNAIPLSVDNFTKEITRGEMAEMIYRIDAKKGDKPSKKYEDLVVESAKMFIEDAGDGKITWEADGVSKKGFKLLWSKNPQPIYPARKGDQAQYLDELSGTTGPLKAFDGEGTYFVRICQYLGEGCGAYSNEIQVALKKEDVQEAQAGVNELMLSAGIDHKVTWKVDGFAKQGFKVVWSKQFGPEYPPRKGDHAEYVGDSNARSYKLWAFDGEGMYSVRVCEYIGDACGVYSNQVNVFLKKVEGEDVKKKQ